LILETNKLPLNIGRYLQNKVKMAVIGFAEVEECSPETLLNSANNVNFMRNYYDFWHNKFLPTSNYQSSASKNLILVKNAVLSMPKYAC